MTNVRARIVVVEDETIVAMDIVAALCAAGYEVVATVGTGERAIEAAEKQKPDLILMDIHLKGAIDGIDAAEIIRRRQQTPIVFLTAHADAETVQRAQTASPYGYLVKPFDQQELGRAIAIALHRARADRSIRDKHRLDTHLQAQGPDGLAPLAGAVVHEFNNLLTVILGRCELLLRAKGNIEDHRHYVSDIRAAAMKKRALTQQLLLAARESLQPQVVDLPEVVASAIHLLAPVVGERVAVRTRLDEATWPVYADPVKLHQLLVNLARNARDAMPHGGTLTIETRNVHADANYARQHVGLRQGQYAALIVSDTGSGRGTGLGLAVARGIVEQSGGSIRMYSEVREERTFKILLPRYGSEAGSGEAED